MKSRKLRRPRTLPMLFGVFLLLALSVGVVSAQTSDESAQLRVVHAAPDAGNVDVYVDGELAIPELAYMDATEFQEIPSGDHDIQVTAAGAPVEDAIIETSASLAGGEAYTYVALGTGTTVELLDIVHEWEAPADDMARMVLVNATSDSANVEILQDGEPIVGEGIVPFGEVATGEVEPGDYNLEVLVEGEPVTTLDGFAVEGGNTYSVFVMGDSGNYEVVPYQDMLGQAPGGEETPEADTTGTPEADETPEADTTGTPEAEETPEADTTGTPEAEETPEADTTGTPETDTTPEADTTGTPEADTTPEADMTGTPEADTTPEADMTPTMDMDDDAMTPSPGTGGGAPEVPATGAGGTAGSSSASGWIALAVAALAVALGGGLVWRSRNERTA